MDLCLFATTYRMRDKATMNFFKCIPWPLIDSQMHTDRRVKRSGYFAGYTILTECLKWRQMLHQMRERTLRQTLHVHDVRCPDKCGKEHYVKRCMCMMSDALTNVEKNVISNQQ